METPDIVVDSITSNKNMSFAAGSLAVLQQIEKKYGFISGMFGNVPTRHKDFVGQAKLLLYNRLNESVSVHQILPTSQSDLFELLGMYRAPKERDLYREVELLGEFFPLLMDRYQQIIQKYDLTDVCQVIDFSNESLAGNKSDLAAFGHPKIIGLIGDRWHSGYRLD